MPRLPRFFPKTRENLRVVRSFESQSKIKSRVPRLFSSLTKRVAMINRIQELESSTRAFRKKLDDVADSIKLSRTGINGKKPDYAPTLRESVFRVCSRLVVEKKKSSETFESRNLNDTPVATIRVEYDPRTGETTISVSPFSKKTTHSISLIIPPALMHEAREYFRNETQLERYLSMYREIWAPMPKKKSH